MSGLRGTVNDFNADYMPEGDNPVLIINTVHDSVIFDLPSWVDEVVLAQRLVAFFTEHPVNVLRDTFGVDFNIPISADADIGMDWYNMKGIEL